MTSSAVIHQALVNESSLAIQERQPEPLTGAVLFEHIKIKVWLVLSEEAWSAVRLMIALDLARSGLPSGHFAPPANTQIIVVTSIFRALQAGILGEAQSNIRYLYSQYCQDKTLESFRQLTITAHSALESMLPVFLSELGFNLLAFVPLFSAQGFEQGVIDQAAKFLYCYSGFLLFRNFNNWHEKVTRSADLLEINYLPAGIRVTTAACYLLLHKLDLLPSWPFYSVAIAEGLVELVNAGFRLYRSYLNEADRDHVELFTGDDVWFSRDNWRQFRATLKKGLIMAAQSMSGVLYDISALTVFLKDKGPAAITAFGIGMQIFNWVMRWPWLMFGTTMGILSQFKNHAALARQAMSLIAKVTLIPSFTMSLGICVSHRYIAKWLAPHPDQEEVLSSVVLYTGGKIVGAAVDAVSSSGLFSYGYHWSATLTSIFCFALAFIFLLLSDAPFLGDFGIMAVDMYANLVIGGKDAQALASVSPVEDDDVESVTLPALDL